MKIVASAKHLAISPRKLRLVAGAVKSQDLDQAFNQLDHLPQRGAKMVKKTLDSAVANATNNFHLEKDNLVIDEIIVDEAGRYKRMDYSHGARFNSGLIQKRLSHLKVVLAEKEEKSAKAVSAKPVVKAKIEAKSANSKIKSSIKKPAGKNKSKLDKDNKKVTASKSAKEVAKAKKPKTK